MYKDKYKDLNICEVCKACCSQSWGEIGYIVQEHTYNTNVMKGTCRVMSGNIDRITSWFCSLKCTAV